MKKLLRFLIYIAIIVIVYYQRVPISSFLLKTFVMKKEIELKDANAYKIGGNYEFVKYSDKFIVNNRTEVFNVIYSIIDNGWTNFSFYCHDDYNTCLADVEDIINNPYRLSYINNFVHPFNSYDKIQMSYSNLGKVQIKVIRLYSDSEIFILNKKVDEIIASQIKDNMTIKEKIKAIHDYIINGTKYDTARADAVTNNLAFDSANGSNKAYGPLVSGMGICGGYSDAMSLFLNKFKVPNYRVSNDFHIWNLVNIDGKWLHLDLTWNDPVVSDGSDVLLDTYFLIENEKLINLADTKHLFDEKIFPETQK